MSEPKKAWEIIERNYYAIKIKLASPMSVSGGLDEYSDSDVLRNGKGELFIPGTSIAGAFRNYLMLEKDKAGMMGFSKEQDGEMSSLYVSDLYLENTKVTVRDAVSLQEDKRVDNKFDMEVVETGAEGTLFFHYIKRENKKQDDFANLLATLLWAMQQGEIRFGSKKNRGFGKVKISKVLEKCFVTSDKDAREKWLFFSEKDVNSYEEKNDWLESVAKQQETTYVKIQVPLRLTGGISVRKYSMEPNKADFEQLTCDGKPVIPGSSWNGAIRAGAREILTELVSAEQAEQFVKYWFGEVDGKTAWQSDIVIAESVIHGGQDKIMTRNKINRFDSSTQSGALYTEKAHFCGTTKLEIMVKKKNGYEGMLGLLQLVIEEICRGQITVGGQTAVGRGIFASYDEESEMAVQLNEVEYYLEGTDEESWKGCKKALYCSLFERRTSDTKL